jgi:hypothetical protein
MNIENISALMGQLQALGFENAGYSLLKRISFKPQKFILSQKIERAKDKLSFQLFFEKDIKENIYVLSYYDAILQKETPLIDATINGINTANLEKSMIEIDWKNAFDFVTKKQLNLEDKTSWEKELKVESVIESLSMLEKSEGGKVVAVRLKLKYWAGIPYQELFGNISPLKNKSEVSQRFYFSEGQTGISVDEAYRFLQNRWLEKQMQAKRKQSNDSNRGDNGSNAQAPASNGNLIKKKLINRTKIDKGRSKKNQN